MFIKGLCRCSAVSPALRALAVLVTCSLSASAAVPPAAPALTQEATVVGPARAEPDRFHPDNQPRPDGTRPLAPPPVYGGTVIVHIPSLPENMNYVVENSTYARNCLYEVHETLVLQDWEYWDFKPVLCKRWDSEDMLVLTTEAEGEYDAGTALTEVKLAPEERVDDDAPTRRDAKVFYGRVTEEGDAYLVTPVSKGNALAASKRIPKAHVDSLQLGAVFTFYLRDDVLWHPSLVAGYREVPALQKHKLDSGDVYFSWELYQNEHVDCDEKRFSFQKIPRAEIVDDLTVRFFYEEQYYLALDAIGQTMTVLPSHIYNLADPDNPKFDADATPEVQGKHINENPHNQLWVGVGPYRVTKYDQQAIEAVRFPDYFDPENGGYFDEIRWRFIQDDNSAFQALLNGELDWFARVKSEDYFGALTEREEFTDNFYKGYFYLGNYGYTGWNLFKPQFKELVVRKAIAHCFDFEEYARTNYKGLVNQISGPFPFNSLAYDHDIKPFPYDPALAEEMLEEAGWYDRNDNGIIDKDGVELEFEFLLPSGNAASTSFGLKLQESLAEVGIKVTIAQMEWATFLDRILDRDFEAINLAWLPDLESDPEQLWGSKWGAPAVRSSNHSGVQDPVLDELIAQGQRELDHAKRQEIWHKMHAQIYNNIQPYLFMYNVPRKYALSKRIRGFQASAIRPGWIIRRWYFTEGEPGTRADR